MKPNIVQLRKSINKAFLKVKPNRTQIEIFKANIIDLYDQINESESEEFHKNIINNFLKETYYSPNHYINTKGRADLVIHNGDDAYSVSRHGKKNTVKPLQYQAYLSFMEETKGERKIFQNIKVGTHLSSILPLLESFRKKYAAFQVSSGFLFGVRFMNNSSEIAERLDYLIRTSTEVLSEKPGDLVGEKGKDAVLLIYSQIIASMQVALAGYDMKTIK
jgi:hypothetical protein